MTNPVDFSNMRNTVFAIAFVALSMSCKEKDNTTTALETQKENKPTTAQKLYGEKFMNVKTLNPDQVIDIYKNLSPGDTVNVTFRAPVKEVCKKKGCWMKVDVGNPELVTVRFKNYGFFVPKDIENKEVTVHGRAFIAEVGVDEQRHLAEDAGEAQEKIDGIKTAQRQMAFTADGVKIGE